MTDPIKKYRRIGLIIAFLIFFIDQASKFVVMQLLQLPTKGQIELIPFFNLTWAENYGVSMGFLTASTDFQRWALVTLTGLIGIAVMLFAPRGLWGLFSDRTGIQFFPVRRILKGGPSIDHQGTRGGPHG